MTLEAHLWIDPAIVYERKQEAEANMAAKHKAKCGKCIHYQTLVIAFETHHGCVLKRRNWQACTYFQQGSK